MLNNKPDPRQALIEGLAGLMPTEDEMKTKQVGHTPGPWEVGQKVARAFHYPDEESYWAIGQRDGLRHYVGKALWMNNDKGLANARLIAAAPELLKAAKDFIWYLDLLVSKRDGIAFDARKAAEAAIAKAEGVNQARLSSSET